MYKEQNSYLNLYEPANKNYSLFQRHVDIMCTMSVNDIQLEMETCVVMSICYGPHFYGLMD